MVCLRSITSSMRSGTHLDECRSVRYTFVPLNLCEAPVVFSCDRFVLEELFTSSEFPGTSTKRNPTTEVSGPKSAFYQRFLEASMVLFWANSRPYNSSLWIKTPIQTTLVEGPCLSLLG